MKLYRELPGFVILLLLAVGHTWPQQSKDWIIGQERSARKQIDAITGQDRLQLPTMRPDWEKARAEANQLLTLTQQIHNEVQAGSGKVPASLAKELQDVQRLAKQLRKHLLL